MILAGPSSHAGLDGELFFLSLFLSLSLSLFTFSFPHIRRFDRVSRILQWRVVPRLGSVGLLCHGIFTLPLSFDLRLVLFLTFASSSTRACASGSTISLLRFECVHVDMPGVVCTGGLEPPSMQGGLYLPATVGFIMPSVYKNLGRAQDKGVSGNMEGEVFHAHNPSNYT
jgi:hypothetical protein